MKSFTIGLIGGSGSGKTSLARDLFEIFSPNASVLALDNYYHPIEKQPRDINGRPNFDLPESLDLIRFKNDLISLCSGEDIIQNEYTFNNSDKLPKNVIIKHRPIIIVEGLFIFELSEMIPMYDLKIFIDTDEDLKLKRRLKRDVETRGYSKEDVEYCHVQHVEPSYNGFIVKQKLISDIIVHNNTVYKDALETIFSFLKQNMEPIFFV